MPEVQHDPAVSYVTAKGVIRASNDSSAWIDAFKSDIVSFLVALCSQAGPLFGSYSVNSSSSRIALTTSCGASDYRIEVSYNNSNDCKVQLKWFGNNVHNLITNFNISNKKPIYWVIFKGRATSHGSGESVSSAFAPDVMVVLARDTDSSINLVGDVSSYHEPTEEEWVGGSETYGILDNICRYVPASLIFCSGLNSLSNSQNECCIIAPINTAHEAINVTWIADASSEHGYCVCENNLSGNRVNQYRTQPPPSDGGFGTSMMITADTVYYPPLSIGGDSFPTNPRPGMVISKASSINYVAPVWSQSSACITTNTKGIVWGGYLDTSDGVHEGPQVVNLGSSSEQDLHLRCLDVFMPVSPPPED